MFRLLLVVVLVAVAVQAHPEEVKVNSNLHKLQKIARRLADVSSHDVAKATCVKKFTFIPVSANRVQESQKCLSEIASISKLLREKLNDERVEFEKALNAASTKDHDVFDFIELTARAELYFDKFFRLTRKDKDAKKDQPKYVNDCVMPVLDEIKKNVEAKETEVKKCFKQ